MIKRDVDDLALFGGPPLYAEPLHVGRPNLGSRQALLQRIDEILDRRWFTNNGPTVREFEARIAEITGVNHCIAMCNATVALEIAIRATGLTGEVIVPSFTFVATAHALQWQQITPVFCDIDPRTHNLDPAQVERLITPRTTGIIGVHVWGRACDVDALQRIADARALTLLFDAAHAFGCTYKGRPLGSFGTAEVFSFHATKFLNSFEGGAVTTNDAELAARVRLMTNFGFAGYDNVVSVGTNGKMTEVSAAMGLTSLDSLDEFVDVNRAHHHTYQQHLRGLRGVSLIDYDATERPNYQYVVIEIDAAQFGLSRDVLLKLLHAEGILARRYFYPGCHLMEPYRSYFPHSGLLLPETNRLTERVLSLPNGTAVTAQDIERTCELLRFAQRHADRIASASTDLVRLAT